MMGYRRAAAALHGLSGDDQEWILSELSGEHGQHVKKYLEELNELGFAEGLPLGDIPALLERPARAAEDRSSAMLCTARAAEIFTIVETEPAALIGRLLLIRDWSWRNDLLKMFPSVRQERIRAVMKGGSPASPALEKFLVEALAARLKSNGKGVRGFGQQWFARLSSSLSRMVQAWSR